MDYSENKDISAMCEVYKAEVEALRQELARKEKEIKRLQETLDLYDREMFACNCDENGVVWTERV